MAIQLYKQGTTHTVRGIECEVKNFDFDDMALMLSQGWVKDPSELSIQADTAPVEEASEESDTNIHPVRLVAKNAGIEGWEIKRIKTLEGLLDELKD